MTDLLEGPAVDQVLSGSRSRPGSTGRRAALVLGLVGAVAGVAAWVLLPGLVAIADTQVLLDARPFVCKDEADAITYASEQTGDPDEQVFVPAVQLHPGLDCTMDVVVRNDGDQDIAVDRITIPMAGPDNGWGIHADRGYQQGLDPAGGEHDIDAVFDYEHDPRAGGSYGLAAHSVQRFRFHLSWSNGCMDDQSAGIFPDSPTAVISAGPWHLPKSWNGPGYAVVGGKNTVAAGCTR